jgi:hypothetical protein
MPGGDGTGSNRNYINCMPTDETSYLGTGRYFGEGRSRVGFGRGMGRGFGQMSMYNPRGLLRLRFQTAAYEPMSREEELSLLQKQKNTIDDRIEQLSKKE